MKSKVFLPIIFCLLAANISAQNKEARKLDEFGELPCGHFMALADSIAMEQINEPGSKILVLYYEGKGIQALAWNKKLKKRENKFFGPRRGSAINRAAELGIYLKSRKFDISNILLADGGYRETFTLEIWLVPSGAAIPKATPTVEEKDVTFSKGYPAGARDCSKAYSM